MRRLGGSTLSPAGTLSSSLFPSISPHLSSSPAALSVSACANYTCANQPTSNEARPVALFVERVEPLLSSRPGGWVERGPALSMSTTSLTLLN